MMTNTARRWRIAIPVLVGVFLAAGPAPAQEEEPPPAGSDRCFFTVPPEKGRGAFRVNFPEPMEDRSRNEIADHKENFSVEANGDPVDDFEVEGLTDPDLVGDDAPLDDDGPLVGFALLIKKFDPRLVYRVSPKLDLQDVMGPPVHCVGQVRIAGDGSLGWLGRSSVTPKYAQDGNGNAALGIDFDVNLASSDFMQTDSGWSAKLATKGSLILPRNGSNSDAIKSSLDAGWEGIWFPWLADDARLTDDQFIEALRAGRFEPLAARAEFHLKHATKQDFADHDVSVGLGAVAVFPMPRVLDTPILLLPLALLSAGPLNFDGKAIGAQQPYFGFSVDYVAMGLGKKGGGGSTDDEDYFRGFAEMAWQGEYFAQDVWLYANLSVWMPFGPPSKVDRATSDVEHYVDVGIKIPVDLFTRRSDLSGPLLNAVAGATGVADDPRAEAVLGLLNGEKQASGPYIVLKYVDGSLPPTFKSDDQISVGFQVDF